VKFACSCQPWNLSSSLNFVDSAAGGRSSATARTVTRSRRRFRAKTKTNSILALTAPTLSPCHPSLGCVFPRVHRYLFLSRCRSSERQKQPNRRNRGLKMLLKNASRTKYERMIGPAVTLLEMPTMSIVKSLEPLGVINGTTHAPGSRC
jgi:hypothetical protein